MTEIKRAQIKKLLKKKFVTQCYQYITENTAKIN